jgi:hypothetical protein
MNPHPTKNRTYYSRVYFPGHGNGHYTTLADTVKAEGGSLFFWRAMEDGSRQLVLVLPASKTEIYRIDDAEDHHI